MPVIRHKPKFSTKKSEDAIPAEVPLKYLIKTGYFRQSLPPDTPIRTYKHDIKHVDRKTEFVYSYRINIKPFRHLTV